MHYVCIEDNKVVSILNYEPGVPASVRVVEISDNDAKKIQDQTHVFDIPTNSVVPTDPEILTQKEIDQKNGIEREFLNSTDWKVMRHIRETALGLPTSLTQDEYLALEKQRADAADRIV